MTNSSFNTNYVSQTLAQAPPNWSKGLWEWYERDRARREKHGEQLAANWEKEVKFKDIYSFKEFMKAGAEFSKSAGTLFEQLEEQDTERKAAEKKETTELWDQLRRGKGTFAAEKKFFEEVHNYRLDKIDILKDKHKFNELIKELPDEVRQQYSRLNASTIVHAREYVGLRVAQGLNGQQHKLYLAEKGEGALEAFENAGDSQDDIFKTWQMEQLRPYGFSNGLVSEVLLEGLNRQASTRSGTARTRAVATRLSNNALQLSESIKARTDNTQNLAQFIISQTSDLKLDRGYKDIEGGPTGMDQAFEVIDNALNELTFNGDILDLPSLLDEKITIKKGDKVVTTTLGEEYYNNKKPGKKGKANKYTDLMKSWEYGQRAIAQKFAVTRDASLQQAFDICAAGDERCTPQFQRLALQTYESKGGDTNKANYKSFSGLKIAAQNNTNFEKEKNELQNILLTGNVLAIENAAKTMGNNRVASEAKEAAKNLKAVRKLNKMDDAQIQTYVRKLLIERGIMNVDIGDGPLPKKAEKANDLIIEWTNEMFYDLWTRGGSNLRDKTLKDAVTGRLDDRLALHGWGKKWGEPGSGMMSSTATGEFPGLEIQRDVEVERVNRPASLEKSHREVNEAWQSLKFKNRRSLNALLQHKGLVTVPEFIAFAQEGFDSDGKHYSYPPDILFKADMLGVQPSKLLNIQLDRLLNSTDEDDQAIVNVYGDVLNKLKKKLETTTFKEEKVLQYISTKGDPDTVAKYKQFGIHRLPPTVLNRIKALEADIDSKINPGRKEMRDRIRSTVPGMANASEEEVDEWIRQEKEKLTKQGSIN